MLSDSPREDAGGGFNSVGTQVSYLRSVCFMDVAEATNGPQLCDKVRSVSTFFYSGADLNRTTCVRLATGHSAVSRALDKPALLDLAGYGMAAVDAFLASLGWFANVE